MCGIAGIIGEYNQLDKNNILKASKHRGPDATGFFDNDKFCFIHTLLKIMDLSDNSIQPMIDPNNGNVIIFNGSIYNYKDLRDKFFSNIKLKSNTDTEILLYLYQKFGLDFLKYIKGMFSFALFDKRLNKIYIIRDRFGIKPLFYFFNSNYFIFASEIKILLSHKAVKNSLSLDFNEVFKFIGFRLIYGSDKTLVKNIKILEPSKYIEFDLIKKKFKLQTYNDEIENLRLNETYSNNFFEKKFDEVVGYHTITEHKKVACLLSGGIDSTLLSVILKAQSQGKEIHTFSAIPNEPNDENINIPKIVKENNFIQHYVYEDSINFFDDHLKTISDMDQPTADAATVTHNRLCKEISKNGFRVIFSGNGADELFFGYPMHIYGYLADVLDNKNIKEYFLKIAHIKKYSNTKELILRSLKELMNLNILNAYKRYQLSRNLRHLEFDNNFKEINYYESFSDNIFKNMILNYKTHWAMQSFLDYEDKNSMAYGLEARVPYLDNDLADLSFRTSLNKHFEIGTKSLLRLHTKMPSYIRDAAAKFALPGPLKSYLEKNIDKTKEKIFYDFKDIPLINVNKLLELSKNLNKNYEIFYRTYSYGIWYKHIFE